MAETSAKRDSKVTVLNLKIQIQQFVREYRMYTEVECAIIIHVYICKFPLRP